MKVIYFGPITPAGQPSTGGFEAANRKNIDALRKRGVEVVELPFPIIDRRLGALGKAAYARLFLAPLTLLRHRNEPDTVFHMTPLLDHLSLPLAFVMRMAKACGLHTLLDVRAGTFLHFWATRGQRYRRRIRRMLDRADAITVEGSAYLSGIPQATGTATPMSYFPNLAPCVADPADPEREPRADNTVNIFYFGRLTAAKGYRIMTDTIKALGNGYRLFLAGPMAPDADPALMDHERITYLGLLTQDELSRQMQKMHIFLFPTSHIGEGQSNSLIEAMANGLIPVAYDQGFCSEVIGDTGKVIPRGAPAEAFTEAIREIARSDMHEASLRCRRRIQSNHNIDIEIPRLISVYKSILSARTDQ